MAGWVGRGRTSRGDMRPFGLVSTFNQVNETIRPLDESTTTTPPADVAASVAWRSSPAACPRFTTGEVPGLVQERTMDGLDPSLPRMWMGVGSRCSSSSPANALPKGRGIAF
ncbi:hypothetical protein EJB05_01187, partial [Eragrostis curvula]